MPEVIFFVWRRDITRNLGYEAESTDKEKLTSGRTNTESIISVLCWRLGNDTPFVNQSQLLFHLKNQSTNNDNLSKFDDMESRLL